MSSIEDVNHLQIPLQELSDATNGFSKENLIAKGGFGKVYKGVSEKHGKIAIKMFYLWPGFGGQRNPEFKSEIALLSVYKHENIVSLLGFCDEDGQKILVYKYESEGSLDQHLDSPNLTWIQRLQICIDVARGLQYLHDNVEPQRRILHGDVKSSNILLNENWKAKISDFGLSKMGNANMQSTFLISGACGTIGYIDPDYLHTGHLTQKSDVYSFGVVLFEVMCGRLTRLAKYNDKRGYLTPLVKIHWGRKTLDGIIYADLHKQINKASFLTFSSIAYQCLMSGNERPTIKEVLEQLEKALDNQLVSSGSDDGNHFAAHLRGQSRLSASSSQSSHAPPSRSWNYDVFISYREADIGNKFVDHLYNALLRKEVVTFIDDATGARAGQSILKAIEESHIIIILFSRNYASSSWCLEELAIIMKHRNERGQIIIPVFYDVEPSEVRSQTGHYGEAFTMHELYNSNKKIESWRQALMEAANLHERHSRAMVDGNEVRLIKRICNDISYKLVRVMQRFEASVANADTFQTGLQTRVQELKSLLKVGSGGVHMVGICGMWGSGKSTIATSIYDEICLEFEGCCFVKNVRVRSRMYGLKMLQEEILTKVLKVKTTIENLEQGQKMMKNKLCKNNFLIVLDDVDHIYQLEMLVGSTTWFGRGSRIIFTTRNQDLVNAHGAITHNVRVLNDIEAIELFSKHAFGKRKPVQGFEKVSLKMVSKLGGHPLALIRLGFFLSGKNMGEWMSILNRIEDIPVAEILKKFKIGDDGVNRDIFNRLPI